MAARVNCYGYIGATVQGPVWDKDKGSIAPIDEEAIDFWTYCSATPVTVEDPGSTEFRAAYENALAKIKEKYEFLKPEFSDDDMTELLTPEERKRGWSYPLTRTQQKREFGVVVYEQERFLARLRDGDLRAVRECLADPERRRAIDVNHRDRGGLAPLHYAALLDLGEVARTLLDAGADPHLRDEVHGLTPLALAERGAGRGAGPGKEVAAALRTFGVKE
uniref:Uncharacterized protein n=1 Tax=Pyrodinium bahamense TaxID=73915 RepID=A0A7S0ADH0_9DINO|mmetsp:Transcript_3176/g.8822  ORF Transcript_3176/g.8822 Transcript_3176/m.8822 type:complete len:220 (+) Transcript_3176:66-725(+)